jgi:hypothetical protein
MAFYSRRGAINPAGGNASVAAKWRVLPENPTVAR